jgi:hypothetical protein
MIPVVHSVAYVAAAAVFLVLGAGAWRRRATRPVASGCLVAVALGGAWWSLADAVIAAGVGAPASGIAAIATFPGIGVIVVAFACLGRSVQGADWVPSRRLLAMLAIEPVLATVAVATNRWHLEFYQGPGAATLGTPNR